MGLKLYKPSSEEELIRACRRKDEKAQRALYEQFAPLMYALCLRYVKGISEAEDVMITGFMRVFNKIDTYQGKGSLGAWVRRIMINESLGYLRKNKTMYVDMETEGMDQLADLNWACDHLQASDLMELVGALPVGYRTVFNLYAIEGYSHKEVGQLLGISESTSKSQLSRARSMLQRMLLKSEESIKTKITNHE